jgi:hypothetical protein
LLRDDGSVAQRYEEPNMTRRFRVLTAALFAFGVCAGPVAAADGEQTITGLLQRSAHDWNHGNLDAFMRGYEDSPATVYMSRSGVIHGYAAIRAHYATHYGSGMGALSFSDLSVRRLGDDYAVVFAHWHLTMKSGAHPTGNFSLLLHRSAAGWHIIEDYTP